MTDGPVADYRPLNPLQEAAFKHITTGVAIPGRAMELIDMGLGKTPIACKVGAFFNCHRWLIICGDNAVDVWRRDGRVSGDWGAVAWIHQWFRDKLGVSWSGVVKVHIMDAEVWNREIEWNEPTPNGEIHLYIVVYNTFSNDMGVAALARKQERAKRSPPYICKPKQGFDIVVIDEARRMRNRKSALFRAVEQLQIRTHIPYLLELTGTPTTRGPQDLYTMLRAIDRKKFPSWWKFVERYCESFEDPWGGLQIVGPRKEMMPEFHALLKQYAVVIKETDPGVADLRPPLTRQKLVVKMDKVQGQMYRDFFRDMMVTLKDGSIAYAQNSMVLLLRLRQILCCPQLIDPTSSPGQAMRDFCQNVEDGVIDLPTVVFSPFVEAFQYQRQYIKSKLSMRDNQIFELKSGIGANEQGRRIEEWRTKRGIILVSIKYAQAFSLEPATKCFFIGYEFDPNDNVQAEKRLHRLTTKMPILANYYTYRNTVDWHIVNDILNFKQEIIDETMPSRSHLLDLMQRSTYDE